MKHETNRRDFLHGSALATAGLLAGSAAEAAQARDKSGQHEHEKPAEHKEHKQGSSDVGAFPRDRAGAGGPVGSASDRGKLVPGYRSPDAVPVGVEMPDLPKLPWKMNKGAKEFHLVAEHVRREVLPGTWLDFWGYNGTMPGALIEAVEGDRVRIIVHNDLPEPTTVHWHGFELPNRMDGVEGLTQDPIPAGKEFVYEFDLHQNGTFFYHSHGAMQEVMGMSGLFVVHPRKAHYPPVDHDFGLIVQEFAVLPLSSVPNSVSEEFNFFTINGRSGPYVTPLVVRLGSRVRIRFMNLSAMDHHPMHLHGHTFWVTGTEGGRIPESAWIPTNNVLVSVGQSRDVEFIANNPGDWMIHCHIPHHMMNHMVSMVGPMVMPTAGSGHSRGESAAMPRMLGKSLGSGELGAGLRPSLGPAVGNDREVMTGMRPLMQSAKFRVPGFPQDMMGMHGSLSPDQMKKVLTPLTRGMRQSWPIGVQAMMTVLRVLPDELYDKVVSGREDIPSGASVPGGGAGKMPGGHSMHEMQDSPAPEQPPDHSEHMQHKQHKK